jgi:hypothetical protein
MRCSWDAQRLAVRSVIAHQALAEVDNMKLMAQIHASGKDQAAGNAENVLYYVNLYMLYEVGLHMHASQTGEPVTSRELVGNTFPADVLIFSA